MAGIINPYRYAAAGGGGGPDVYYYGGSGNVEAGFTSSGSVDWNTHQFCYGGVITVATGGTCTIISAKVGVNSGSIDLKVALYNSSNNLLTSGSAAAITGSGVWRDIAVSQAVTAGTYKVLWSTSTNQGIVFYDSAETGIYDEVVYASFPAASITPSNDSGFLYGVRMYVD